jgi:SAM-dependent methyltransferase
MFNFLGPLEGKTILDLGCGYNPTPVYLALAGAKKVIACDVSPRAIDFVLSMSRQYSLQHQIIPHLEPADSLSLEDSSIDLIHGEAVLHHLDLNRAGTQLSRVLKKGGRAVFKDPLGHNFLLELARDYLPYPWKHPIKGTDRPLRFPAIKQFGQYFSYSDARGFGLFSMIAIILFGRGRSRSQSIAHGIEERVLRAIPWLQRACRFVVTRVEK